ncbi:ester cyclase [Mycobacterium sp. ML4]
MADRGANKALVRRHLLEAINRKQPGLWAEIMSEDFDIHHPLVEAGRVGYARAIDVLWRAFPDVSIEILDLVAEDDRVVARYVDRGTHLGEFMGLPPSGRTYAKHGFAMYRIAGGRLAEAWIQEDDLAFQTQLFGPADAQQ